MHLMAHYAANCTAHYTGNNLVQYKTLHNMLHSIAQHNTHLMTNNTTQHLKQYRRHHAQPQPPLPRPWVTELILLKLFANQYIKIIIVETNING